MKKWIGSIALCLCLVGLTGCPQQVVVVTPPPVTNPDWTITANFSYDFTNFVINH